MNAGPSSVQDPSLERQGKRLAAPSPLFLLLTLVFGVPGVILVILGHHWVFGVGVALIAIALGPAVVALTLLGSSAVARWAARRKPFA
jgi:hypothetical protein